MAPAGKKTSKPVYKTDIPFTETTWPQASPQDQEIILDLLCNLIEPLGDHRKTHLPPSKGKKRKRPSDHDKAYTPPPAPPLANHLIIGLNSVTRHLSTLAAYSKPSVKTSEQGPTLDSTGPSSASPSSLPILPNIALLILPTLTPSTSLAHAHLPTLLYLSSTSSAPTTTATLPRLVTLPPSSETRLACALHIPRVGAIAVLEGAPGANPLVQYVQEKVGIVKCKWIEEGLKAEWKGMKGSF